MARERVLETRVLLDGFGMGESPRWHEGRLWFSNWGTNEIVAVDVDGNSEVIGAGGGGSGWAVNWLPDGRMLVTGGELRQAIVGHVPDGPQAWLVVASAGGAAHHPQWLYNLARNPDATLEFGDGRRVPVRADSPAGADLDDAWEKISKAAPIYAGYRTKTDREIPVIRLREVT